MALIKVRATATGFNGGPNERSKSIWAYKGDPKNFISDRDRGMKSPGDVFMIEEKNFTDTWMERVDPLPAVTAVTQAAPAVVSAPEAVKRGRPKKVV